MVDNILKFKTNSLTKSRRLRIFPGKNSPTLDITIAESLIIEKFLNFAIKNIEHQIEMTRKIQMSSNKMTEIIVDCSLVKEHLNVLLREIERGLIG